MVGTVLLALTGPSFAQQAEGMRLGGTITRVDGDKLDIKTDDVPPSTPIAAMKPGKRDLVKKGARVSIFRAQPSGTDNYTASAITVISTPNWPPK